MTWLNKKEFSALNFLFEHETKTKIRSNFWHLSKKRKKIGLKVLKKILFNWKTSLGKIYLCWSWQPTGKLSYFANIIRAIFFALFFGLESMILCLKLEMKNKRGHCFISITFKLCTSLIKYLSTFDIVSDSLDPVEKQH